MKAFGVYLLWCGLLVGVYVAAGLAGAWKAVSFQGLSSSRGGGSGWGGGGSGWGGGGGGGFRGGK